MRKKKSQKFAAFFFFNFYLNLKFDIKEYVRFHVYVWRRPPKEDVLRSS